MISFIGMTSEMTEQIYLNGTLKDSFTFSTLSSIQGLHASILILSVDVLFFLLLSCFQSFTFSLNCKQKDTCKIKEGGRGKEHVNEKNENIEVVDNQGSGFGYGCFSGSLDEIRIWKQVSSQFR